MCVHVMYAYACGYMYICIHVCMCCVWCICVHIYVLDPEPYLCKTDLYSIEFYTVHYICYMLFIQSLSLEVISIIFGARKSITCVDVCALCMCVRVCMYVCSTYIYVEPRVSCMHGWPGRLISELEI